MGATIGATQHRKIELTDEVDQALESGARHLLLDNVLSAQVAFGRGAHPGTGAGRGLREHHAIDHPRLCRGRRGLRIRSGTHPRGAGGRHQLPTRLKAERDRLTVPGADLNSHIGELTRINGAHPKT